MLKLMGIVFYFFTNSFFVLATETNINVDHKFFCLATEYYVKSKEKNFDGGEMAAANFCGNIKENVNMRITCLAMVTKDTSSLKKVCAEDFPLCHAFTSEKFKASDCQQNFKNDLTSKNICLAYHKQDMSYCQQISVKDPLHYTCKAMLAPKADQCELIALKTKSNFNEIVDFKIENSKSAEKLNKKHQSPRDVSSINEKEDKPHVLKINDHEEFEFDSKNESLLEEEIQ
jgi:hypothetical protein